jgi:hypothetical protein
MDEKTHAVVARLLDCIHRMRERESERETPEKSRERESREREIARENRRIVATSDCTTNSYPEEQRTVKISSHFSPKTAGKFVRKNQTDRERIVAGKREQRDFVARVILVVLCGYDGEGRGECSSGGGATSSSDQTWKCEVVFEGGLRSSGSEPAGVATSVEGQRSRGMFAQARHLLRAFAACVPHAQALGRS